MSFTRLNSRAELRVEVTLKAGTKVLVYTVDGKNFGTNDKERLSLSDDDCAEAFHLAALEARKQGDAYLRLVRDLGRCNVLGLDGRVCGTRLTVLDGADCCEKGHHPTAR